MMKPTTSLYALTIAALLAALLACSAPATSRPVAIADTPKSTPEDDFALSETMTSRALTNNAGLTVELVYLSDDPEGRPRALLRFRGAPHTIAGKVLLVHGRVVDGEYHWSMRFDEQDMPVLWTTHLGAGESYTAHTRLKLPRAVFHVELEYDGARSQAIDIQALIAMHKRQREEGIFDKLESVDRDYYIAREKQSLERSEERTVAACGRKIPFEIDFDSLFVIPNQYRKGCARTIEDMKSICERDADSRRIFNAKVRTVECRYGQRNHLAISQGGTLSIELDPKTSYFKDAYDQLKHSLKLTRAVGMNDAGQVLTLDPDDYQGKIYFGDAKVLHRLHRGRSSHQIWTPMAGVSILKTPQGLLVNCPTNRPILFKPVSDEKRLAILEKAEYVGPSWHREPYALARDERGIYYYVDRLQKEFGGKNYRVFVGQRGQVEVTTLLDIVNDSDGMIFATNTGNLRLIFANKEHTAGSAVDAGWLIGKKRRKLVVLSLHDNRKLLYGGLDIYKGQNFGTPCD